MASSPTKDYLKHIDTSRNLQQSGGYWKGGILKFAFCNRSGSACGGDGFNMGYVPIYSVKTRNMESDNLMLKEQECTRPLFSTC
jgi:hypothetical protein